MELYLLRHGIAEDANPGQPDEQRQLTDEGRKKLKAVLRVTEAAGVKPDLILTSPLVRAVQTAEIAAERLGYKGDLLHTSALSPDSTPEAVWTEVRLHTGSERMLIVGHNPLFASLVGFLLNAPSLQIDFKKGGIVRIDVQSLGPHPYGVLQWILTPKLAS